MFLISHRGNINGPNSSEENKPQYIQNAIKDGFEVECDVWEIDGTLFLGHDNPQYEIDLQFLEHPKLWIHAKNISALYLLIQNPNIHCFYHDKDDATLTSKGFIWTYIGKPLFPKSICVLPEVDDTYVGNCCGICSDYIIRYWK